MVWDQARAVEVDDLVAPELGQHRNFFDELVHRVRACTDFLHLLHSRRVAFERPNEDKAKAPLPVLLLTHNTVVVQLGRDLSLRHDPERGRCEFPGPALPDNKEGLAVDIGAAQRRDEDFPLLRRPRRLHHNRRPDLRRESVARLLCDKLDLHTRFPSVPADTSSRDSTSTGSAPSSKT